MKKSRFQIWMRMFRPWSLTASFVPIFLMACWNCFDGIQDFPYEDGAGLGTLWKMIRLSDHFPFYLLNFFLALLSCGSLQIACNLLNEWGDYRSGVDQLKTVGVVGQREGTASPRELVAGTVTPAQVLRVALLVLGIGIAAGGLLLYRCFSWTLLAVAVVGVLGTVNYTTGIRFKYRGYGLVCVFFLMGYLLLGAADLCLGGLFLKEFSRDTFLAFLVCGLPTSCLVTCIMHANDMRDIEKDRMAGIRTPATIFGKRGALWIFTVLHTLPYLTGGVFLWSTLGLYACSAWEILMHCVIAVLPWLLLLPLTIQTLLRAYREKSGDPSVVWSPLLGETARLHFLSGLLLGGWIFLLAISRYVF
ncbi:MAG: prenyltransferase [Kiritimatiellae bacterium]|nr:prenyltransferase [Kiritimatiellia bacterium]